MTSEQGAQRGRQLLQTLESLHGAGVCQLPRPTPMGAAMGAATPQPISDTAEPDTTESDTTEPDTAGEVPNRMEAPSDTSISSAATLDLLASEVASCTLCDELASTRTQTVFGVGAPKARLCFLGEAPGADEDRLGEPFVGRGGKLLNKILEACKIKREEVYILNILKCRPPNNRNPTTDESQNCRRFLDRQLQLIAPDFICCLGAVAAQNLLQTTVAIGRLRGEVHNYRNIKVVCTYHPAYLLRNPSAKRHTWDDMKLLMREMGTPIE